MSLLLIIVTYYRFIIILSVTLYVISQHRKLFAYRNTKSLSISFGRDKIRIFSNIIALIMLTELHHNSENGRHLAHVRRRGATRNRDDGRRGLTRKIPKAAERRSASIFLRSKMTGPPKHLASGDRWSTSRGGIVGRCDRGPKITSPERTSPDPRRSQLLLDRDDRYSPCNHVAGILKRHDWSTGTAAAERDKREPAADDDDAQQLLPHRYYTSATADAGRPLRRARRRATTKNPSEHAGRFYLHHLLFGRRRRG